MDFKWHLETAWNQTLKYLSPLIIMTLILVIVSSVTFGILTMVMMAGYINAILQMLRDDRPPQIQDLFSKMNLFLPLFIFSIAAAIIISIGFKLLVLPGLSFACALAFGCLYVIPLMVDQKLGIIQAIKSSWDMAMKNNIADQVVVTILYVGLISIGISTLGIGIFLTHPFATVFIGSVYLEKQKQIFPPQ